MAELGSDRYDWLSSKSSSPSNIGARVVMIAGGGIGFPSWMASICSLRFSFWRVRFWMWATAVRRTLTRWHFERLPSSSRGSSAVSSSINYRASSNKCVRKRTLLQLFPFPFASLVPTLFLTWLIQSRLRRSTRLCVSRLRLILSRAVLESTGFLFKMLTPPTS